MSDNTCLDWPFIDAPQRAPAADVEARAALNTAHPEHAADVDALCRDLVARLGRGAGSGTACPQRTAGYSNA